jgi:FtsP/CotA-like multicopper oxidase with cupredoxin domain
MTLFYSNQQSARLMFYHDHAYGITRLNVYAGEAAGYLLQDPAEQQLIASGILPADQIPLIIQDKSFVPKPAQLAAQDPTWDSVKYGGQGNLWLPHVYMPNQNPFDLAGANAMGRWDYGPWFWPPYTGLAHGPVANPYYTPGGTQPPQIPGTPNPSIVPEAFMDTAMVNGTAYPYLVVQPKAYRLRILNASNDRFWNLSLYESKSNKCMWDPSTGTLLDADAGEVNMVPAVPNPAIPFPEDWVTATDGPGIKPDILDGRSMGLPDPRKLGPSWIQIGTEGGMLPAPVVLDPKPTGYQYNLRNIVVLNVTKHSLYLGPAERADVIVDFSQYAGKTLILYNDAPAPVPAGDPRLDYYTGDLDQTATGGAPTTLPGYGPNTRTIMQIRVGLYGAFLPLILKPSRLFLPLIEHDLTGLGFTVEGAGDNTAPAATIAGTPPGFGSCAYAISPLGAGTPYNLTALNAAFASTSTKQGIFAATQDPIIVPQADYNSAYNANYPADAFVRIQDTTANS